MTAARPAHLTEIEARSRALGFDMNSDPAVGRLLAALAASRPGGMLLEIGTGCGLGAAWLLSGMDAGARLVSVDSEAGPQAIAREVLGGDARADFIEADAGALLETWAAAGTPRFDLIFADAWPGKFSHLDAALATLAPGGVYVADDLHPQPNWPQGHQASVDAYLADLRGRAGYVLAELDWATGVAVLVRR